jgi:serine/threonine-protein kinase
MSPEQMRSSRDVDHRSDIWSLGIVLYELLQGTPPFGGDTFSSMVIKVVTEALPRMTVQLPGDLEAIVYHCLEKDPARRFQNVAELAQMLAPYAQSQTQAAISIQRTRSIIGLENQRSATDTGPARRAIPPSTLSGAVGARTTTGGGRRWPIFAGIGVLGAVVAIAVVASNSGHGTAGDPKAGVTPAAQTTTPPPPTAAAAATPPPPPAAATAPAGPAVAPATPSVTTPVTTPPAPPANGVATAPATPPAAVPAAVVAPLDAGTATAQTAPTRPTAGTPDAAAKKPKKPTKPGTKPDGGSAKPPSDEDVLGTRN